MISKTFKISFFLLAIASFSFVGAQEKKKNVKLHPEKMFKDLDADANGVISLEEFKQKRMKDSSKEAHVEKRFTAMDTDKNGLVNMIEFNAFLERPIADKKSEKPKMKKKKN